MKTITEAFIQHRFRELKHHACTVFTPTVWAVQPVGDVLLAARKTAFGLATKDGQVFINQAFVGTSAFRKLDQTILHELAHLIAGLHRHHGQKWKNVAAALGMSFAHFEDDECQIIANISYKYTVYAHLENGEVRILGQVHKKTKKYTAYPDGTTHRTKDGLKVLRYTFEE
jgi:predicted SprT family Zn-dependent metalloprotease